MSFVKIPSKIHYGSKYLKDNYVGIGTDDGKYLWRVPTTGTGYTYIKSTTVPTWTFTDSVSGAGTFTTTGEYGGEISLQSTNGWLVYYVPSMQKWLMVKDALHLGYIPRAAAVADVDENGTYTYTYSGDIWWEASSFNPMPWNGATAGTFRFALASYASTYTELAPYNVNHVLTGDLTPPFAKVNSGVNPNGFYNDNTYVGFPEWRYSSSGYHYITKYGSQNTQWDGLKYFSVSSIGTHPLNNQWTGWVATGILAGTITAAPTGFYAMLAAPTVQNSTTLNWYHFVPDDPDDPDSSGTIQTDTSWVDDEGNTHQQPAITVSWQDLRGESNVRVSRALITARIGVGEAAIWR